MQQPHHPARIADRLLEPHYLALAIIALIFRQGGVLGETSALISGGDGEDEQEGVGGAREECEQFGLGDAVDVVHGKVVLEAQAVEEVGHQLGVGFEGDESWFACGGGGGGGGGHGCWLRGGKWVFGDSLVAF